LASQQLTLTSSAGLQQLMEIVVVGSSQDLGEALNMLRLKSDCRCRQLMGHGECWMIPL
jgi:hypothetical protein